MSIDMMKKAATVSITKALQKSADAGNDPGDIEVELEMYIDSSTSMRDRYINREMQTVVDRNVALLLTGLDSDHTFPLYKFDHKVVKIAQVTEQNRDTALNGISLFPATEFLPIIKQVKKNAPKDAKNQNPRVVVVDTDGIPGDRDEFLQEVADYASEPVFWIFFGHGQQLDFLRELDTMEGRVVDNVALVEVDDVRDLSDEEYYDKVVDELITSWFPKARQLGITNK